MLSQLAHKHSLQFKPISLSTKHLGQITWSIGGFEFLLDLVVSEFNEGIVLLSQLGGQDFVVFLANGVFAILQQAFAQNTHLEINQQSYKSPNSHRARQLCCELQEQLKRIRNRLIWA
jgi:hypothetical protein